MVYNNGFFSTGTPNGAETLRNSQNDRRSLHRLGNLAGMGLVLFVVFQFIALIILTVTGLEDEYIYDTTLLLKIDKEYAKTLGYVKLKEFDPMLDSIYRNRKNIYEDRKTNRR